MVMYRPKVSTSSAVRTDVGPRSADADIVSQINQAPQGSNGRASPAPGAAQLLNTGNNPNCLEATTSSTATLETRNPLVSPALVNLLVYLLIPPSAVENLEAIMRGAYLLLPLAAVAAAFIIPDEETFKQLILEDKGPGDSVIEEIPSEAPDDFSGIEGPFSTFVDYSEGILETALSLDGDVGKKPQKPYMCMKHLEAFDANAWLATGVDSLEQAELDDGGNGPPHHGPPHRGPPHRGPPYHGPHRPPHHRRPHHGHRSNLTIWQLISKSKYTTKIAKLISSDKQLVHLLNCTKANHTIFVPIDAAFKRIPKHHKKLPKEFIEKVLKYHIVPGWYPAGRVLMSHTIPTILNEAALGGEPQRLRVGFGLKGVNINFFSHVKAANIFTSNGVIHAVDHIILPPPPGLKIIELVPSAFSTLHLGLLKTGLFEEIEKSGHIGGTLFAPSNFAFKKLGPTVNAFLFSPHGLKYLKALLEYHVVPDNTLYSDKLYKYSPKNEREIEEECPHGSSMPRRGRVHVSSPDKAPKAIPLTYATKIDLPTLLHNHHLSIDIARFGRLISIVINGFNHVSVLDGIAKDGVLHVVPNVLIPPKTPGGKPEVADEEREWTVEEFKERLEGLVGGCKNDENDL
ncbi:MAG: hypothetical protein M1839_006850 [Geoglossum umbratile]|nr:MAG: hypothetical protein M1839_006850 [Geoglossum umbratile]